jgi:hypothetical protein
MQFDGLAVSAPAQREPVELGLTHGLGAAGEHNV